MGVTANWYFEIDVVDGHSVSGRGTETTDTVDFSSVDVDAAAVKAVDLLPDTAAGKVSLLVLKPSALSDQVTFSFKDPAGTPPPPSFSLEAPVVLIGAGAVQLLPSPPLKLWLKNATADPVAVDILIGRDTTP
ncbi:hypothetical protein ABZ477_17345 [Microbacterium sp. NPDC019599]|uniref:hypothetical protein n=1 Tax=Microbacterium sp. NPDC019599 TaxID=3154690 RepID=UPI0033F568B7